MAPCQAALPLLGRYGLPLLVHAELPQPLSEEPSGAPQVYETYLKSRPPEWCVHLIYLPVYLLQVYVAAFSVC